MQHRQQSRSFHYTPAEIYYLPFHGGREIERETERERARCSINRARCSNNLRHSITLLPRSMICLLREGGRYRARKRATWKGEIKSETEGERARCSICNNLRHSITLLPKSIITEIHHHRDRELERGKRQRARSRKGQRDAASATT